MWQILRRIGQVGQITEPVSPEIHDETADALHSEIHRVFGRALCIRHVDAGSCNACELEIHALGNPYYNLEGLGIKFVASPRHADLLLVTGTVTRNMEEALARTYAAMPSPKFVLAAGACATGQMAIGADYACLGAVSNVIPVDAAVEGCPPAPAVLLRAILSVARGYGADGGSERFRGVGSAA